MAYHVGQVANYILDLADRDGVPVSPMKLQKLVYLAHGYHLALTEQPLIDEPIEAWQFGPVVSSLYHAFKRFGSQPIEGNRYTYLHEQARGGVSLIPYELPSNSYDDRIAKAIIKKVWDIYKQYTAIQLSSLTHKPNSPWSSVWDKAEGLRRGIDIDNDQIQTEFKRLIPNS